MKNKILAITMSVILVLLVGCGKGTPEQTTVIPYIGGNDGIVAEFEIMGEEKAGQYEIYQTESFPIQINLKNKGEYNLAAGEAKVTILGILLSDFSGIALGTLPNKAKIDSISELSEEGGEEIIDFGSAVKYTQVMQGSTYPANIVASYTYDYKTYASVQDICFKENLRDKRICEVEEAKKVYSSAAPVQVKSAVEKVAGAGLVEVDFEIENVGKGKTAKPGDVFSEVYDQLACNIEPSSEASKWTCTGPGGENSARLVDKKATVRCKLKEPLKKGDLYTKAVGLTLSYQYRDSVKASLLIKKQI